MKGFKVSNDGVVVILNYKHVKVTFDRVIHATDGCVTGVLIKPLLSDIISGFANESISNERIYDINHLHKLFGHCGQEIINKTIKMYDLSPLVALIHENSVLSRRHNRKTLTRTG
jgi:hypothetical protein